ncbi:hypothetical protein Bbelb_113750 [Branchiostoma belcheri]|nr:hypothetical protein Bbelb_113750 [Branchiostoma belcheri]
MQNDEKTTETFSSVQWFQDPPTDKPRKSVSMRRYPSSVQKEPPRVVHKYNDVTEDRKREFKERKKQKQKKRQEREEEERLKQLQDEVNRKRQELLNYRFGDIHGQQYFAGLGLNVRDMQEEGLIMRIGLLGPAGSGKSSFVNTCERALKPGLRRGTADIQTAHAEGTVVLQEFLDDLDNDFCLVDTRGLFRHDVGEFSALADIVYGRIRPGQEVTFETPADKEDSEEWFPNWLHAIIIVLSAADPRLQDGNTHRNNLKIVRDFMLVTVITHHDRIDKSQEDDILAKASAATGSSRDRTFFVANYHIDKTKTDYHTEMEAMEVMKSALNVAERYVVMHKLQEQLEKYDEASNNNVQTTAGRSSAEEIQSATESENEDSGSKRRASPPLAGLRRHSAEIRWEGGTGKQEPRAYGARGPLKQWDEPPHSKSWLRA